MPLPRIITRTPQDAAASEPAQPQQAKIYDIAGRPGKFTGEESGRRQKLNRVGSALAAMLSRAVLAVRRWRATVSMSGKALAIASAAGLLLLLGFVVYANRRPASPLGPSASPMNQSVKDLPFGPAAITPPAARPLPPATTAPGVRPTTPKPSAARRRADLHRRLPPDDSSTAKQQSE
ncbi:MAG: hypothetical protein WB347_23960 [Terriglobales bacterium]